MRIFKSQKRKDGMKILHTSDWHIGKKLMNRDRLDEQQQVLAEITELCDREGVELVLVAGDVFDTFLPSAEAENLFFSAVRRLAGEARAVLIISGNHDDPRRLSASAPFGEELGVYIVGNQTGNISLGGDRPVRPVQSGEGYVVFENRKGERVYVNTLPYPNEARLNEEKVESGAYGERVKGWIARGNQAYEGGMPEILLSHLFVAGGVRSDGERDIDLGGARAVTLEELPDCDYIALGHLHKKQHFTKKNVWYSGSILQYSFDEAGMQKYVVLLETDKEKLLSACEVPLRSGKNLVRAEASDVEEGISLLEKYADHHVELTLKLTATLTAAETKSLSSHKCLVSLLPQVNRQEEGSVGTSRRGKNKAELFDEYYRSIYGVEPEAELKRLFLEITQEQEAGE
jgi:exonuclease SbcD